MARDFLSGVVPLPAAVARQMGQAATYGELDRLRRLLLLSREVHQMAPPPAAWGCDYCGHAPATVNELRARLGLPPTPGGDVPLAREAG